MDEELTRRQNEIFKFIRKLIDKRGYGPTVREIAEEFDFASPNGALGHLRALERKGYITRQAHKSRSIELSPSYTKSNKGLPLSGVVAAGAMHEAIEQHERIDFSSIFNRKNAFVLEVSGDSMIDAHICDGDHVVVQPARTANKGDIVVVRDDEGDATLKYWFPEKNRIRLQPANRRMKPIYSRDAKVIGVVVGVIRRLR